MVSIHALLRPERRCDSYIKSFQPGVSVLGDEAFGRMVTIVHSLILLELAVVRLISLGYQCCDGHAGHATSILTIDRYLASTVRSHPHKLKGGKTYTVANCDQSKNKESIKDDFGSGFQDEKAGSCLLCLVANRSTYPNQYILIQ